MNNLTHNLRWYSDQSNESESIVNKHFAATMCLKSSCLQAVYTVYLHLSTKLGAIRDLLWSSFDYRTAVSAFGAVGCGFDGFCVGFVWFCWWQKVLELLFLL